jgi:hypothetical protein
MTVPWAEASALQRPLSDGALQTVTRGSKQDGAEAQPEAPVKAAQGSSL